MNSSKMMHEENPSQIANRKREKKKESEISILSLQMVTIKILAQKFELLLPFLRLLPIILRPQSAQKKKVYV